METELLERLLGARSILIAVTVFMVFAAVNLLGVATPMLLSTVTAGLQEGALAGP